MTKRKAARSTLPRPLGVKQVFAPCPLDTFRFRTTKDVKATDDIIAQDRAITAIKLGLGIRKPGYNIYVAGHQGTGKTSVIKAFVESWSKNQKAPPDWVYVHNFAKPEVPSALTLPAGEGRRLVALMEKAVKGLRKEIPHVLQSEDYENAVNGYVSQNNEKQSRKFSDLEKIARKMNFQLKSTRMGIETIPVVDGRVLTEKEYSKLTDGQRDEIESKRSRLEPLVLEFARKARALELDTRDYITNLQQEIVRSVAAAQLHPVSKKFGRHEAVTAHLDAMLEYVVENLTDFIDQEDMMGEEEVPHHLPENRDRLRKYRVNLFVDNADVKSAPVVIESNPTFYNLFGRVERNVDHGMFTSDFTMICAGSIYRANGGYLVLDVNDMLKIPFVWETLKRFLRNSKGFIEDIGEQMAMLPTTALHPEPIPLDLKVVLIGTDEIYHLLHQMDEDFHKIFKIKADFDFKMVRNRSNIKSYVSFVATRSRKEELLNFDRSGLASIVEYGSRLVEDQTQLSTQFGAIKDLTIEADFVARQEGARTVKRSHVGAALREKFQRVSLIEQQMMEMVKSDGIIVSIDGARVGQVNALAVYDMGDYSFGKVSRITCTTAINSDGIFNVERASKLSGNIHDKGVYILAGYVNALLARERSLSISTSVCFEQSYGIIDGDSATAAELSAIFSAISEIPIKQNFALTGSLSQLGDIQPVGGINEKVEGFCRTCRLMGKGKEYHLIIPHQNVVNLMLDDDTREAISSGFLKIYPVRSFWEVFELLTDVPLGAKTIHDTKFTRGSALERIAQRLDTLYAAELAEQSGRMPPPGKAKSDASPGAISHHRSSRRRLAKRPKGR